RRRSMPSYYYPSYSHPSNMYGYYDQYHTIYDQGNNIVERNPYPFDYPYFDRRMVESGYRRRSTRPYPYYDSRYVFHGRVDPYTSYQSYYETPLLSYPQPSPSPSVHPFYTPDWLCTIM
ncbi:hypothetical protein RYX36_012742, partial [Vicia faba]